MFNLKASFKPTGDQPQAISKLCDGIKRNLKNQVLLGVTGSGKTFTMANIIQNQKLPTLIISHNKTLAGQLYQEFRDFFPNNAVSYFVSYYDYYQPESYLPQTDTYIEKEADINKLIEKLRLQTMTNILTKRDVIVVASVSCIYNIGSPDEYKKFVYKINIKDEIDINNFLLKLINLQYVRSEFDFLRGTFRVRNNLIDIYPSYEDYAVRIYLFKNKIVKIDYIDPLTGKVLNSLKQIKSTLIFPAKQYIIDKSIFKNVESEIRKDLSIEYKLLKNQKKKLEAERLLKRVNFDLEMINEVGYVNGIENYYRYFDNRKPDDPPYTIIDFFDNAFNGNYLVFIDESHMTVPQLKGMYNGDYSRKKTLVSFGFRLKAAFDNRPLKFEEFYKGPKNIIYFSATPSEWEINISKNRVINQLIRPTGILDPKIFTRSAKDEIIDLLKEIKKRVKVRQKILVTTLTKKTAEDLSEYLLNQNVKAEYLHSDIQTLERSDILDNLRKNKFDVIIGVNLLREGLDLPEVSLVAILDADKEGFLRSKTSLIQTMGRAARNISGEVIIYMDKMTNSIKQAISEIDRRRNVQIKYNIKNKIIPKNIYKPVRERIIKDDEFYILNDKKVYNENSLNQIKKDSLTSYDKTKIIKKLEREMVSQANNLNFELAIKLRDKINELKNN